jgi:hypothetical protein
MPGQNDQDLGEPREHRPHLADPPRAVDHLQRGEAATLSINSLLAL